jgi:hypothetical protein
MQQHAHQSREDINPKIGAYEAFLDLLTLISFLMIFAASIYMARSPAGPQSTIASHNAVRNPDPKTVAADEVIISILREGGLDKLRIVDGRTSSQRKFRINTGNIDDVLASTKSMLDQAKNIDLAVYEDEGSVNAGLVLSAQRWFSLNNYSRYRFYFVGAR